MERVRYVKRRAYPRIRLTERWLTYSTGAFVAAPVGGLLWGFGALVLRLGFQWSQAKVKGHRFDALDRPFPARLSFHTANHTEAEELDPDREQVNTQSTIDIKGKFF